MGRPPVSSGVAEARPTETLDLRGRFVGLFVLMLVVQASLPLFEGFGGLRNIAGVGFVFVLSYAGLLTIEVRHRKWMYLVAVLASLVGGILIPSIGWFWLGLHTLLFGGTAVLVVTWAVRRDRVTLDTVFAALSGYYLLGYTWAIAYTLLDTVSPGSFSAVLTNPGDAFYFSFITMLSVGYGDIVPISAGGRALVVLEALIGQVYLVVFVARLVSVQVIHSQDAGGGSGSGSGSPPSEGVGNKK